MRKHSRGRGLDVGVVCVLYAAVVVICVGTVGGTESGDEQLAQAFDAAVMELVNEGELVEFYNENDGPWTDDGAVTILDCLYMPGVDMYPENPQGTLLKVLTEGTFYSATTSLSDLSPVDLIFDQIGMHYGVQILVSKSQAYSTDEEIFAAVVDGEIDGTDSTMSVVSPTHDTSEVLDLREGCSVYGSQPLLASLVTTGINNTYQLNEVINYRLSVGQTSQVCCETDFEKTLFELLFPNAEIIVMNTPALCAQYMKSQPDVVLASKATQNQVDLDNALTAYRAATIFPITSFFRKEILEQNKVSIDQEVQWFDQGNTALVTLVDNALMSLVFSEDQEYQDIFHSYNYTDIFFTADCFPPTNPMPIIEGTIEKMVNSRQFVIGIAPTSNMPLIEAHDTHPTGIIPDMEKIITSTISQQLGVTLSVTYKMYDSPDQILNALVAGEIDGTSLQFFEGGLFNGTERRTIEFQRSCSSLAMLMEFVSARSSGIYSFEMLEVYLDNFPTAAVGVFTDGTRQIVESILPDTPIEMYADITSTIEAVISGEIVAFMPDTIAQVPQPYFSQLISYGSNEYQPLVMFFRNDKVYPCGNEIVEPEYGEECEAESTDFCNSNCQCSSGYKSMNNQCVADDDTNVAGIVVGSLVGVAVILAAAVGAIVFGLWFYRNHKRPSSSYQLARPLVTPDDL